MFEDIKQLANNNPFKPFRVSTTEGKHYWITDPGTVSINSEKRLVIDLTKPTDEKPVLIRISESAISELVIT